MNRQIKFRAWSKKRLSMEQVCGYWWEEEGCNSENLAEGFNYDDYVLMQFTGLTDKNGKEIYEGDLLHYIFDGASYPRESENKMLQCLYDVKEGMYAFQNSDSDYYWAEIAQHSEVIGNIFENPELL